jgi:uncharacterized membrane protein YedE/YeeE
MTDFLIKPWPWWFSGIVISAIMFLLLYFGKSFGFSSNLRTICAMSGAGKRNKFFQFDWKAQGWNLVFLVGALAGGYISHAFLSDGSAVQLADSTIKDLSELGMAAPASLQPEEIFGWEALLTVDGFLLLSLGGLFIGFGSRYAGGCTSGHAISGLSDLQIPSLITVMGFFIGGLLMTHIIFPLIF